MENKFLTNNFDGISLEARLLFFIDIGFFFSMQIRGKYLADAFHCDDEFRSINESSHRIFQCLRGIALNNDSHIPDGTVLQMLLDIAKEGDVMEELNWAINEAEKRLNEKGYILEASKKGLSLK